MAGRSGILWLKSNLISCASIKIGSAHQPEIETLNNFRRQKVFAILALLRPRHLPGIGFILRLFFQVCLSWGMAVDLNEFRVGCAIAEIHLIDLFFVLF